MKCYHIMLSIELRSLFSDTSTHVQPAVLAYAEYAASFASSYLACYTPVATAIFDRPVVVP